MKSFEGEDQERNVGVGGERNEVVMQAEEIELGDNHLQGLEAEINLR